MDNKYNIGDVRIVPAKIRNPYLYTDTGQSRRDRLAALRDGVLSTDWQAWYAPSGGGARRITAGDVYWEGMKREETR
jgi:hypothetical protein